jgi:CRISPR-associated protein Csm4
MKLYRIRLRQLSPSRTPWQSDTLFGQLCWQVALHDGDGAVGGFIGRFRNDPPFVLSDAFPAGLLPRPLLPWLGRGEAENTAEYAKLKKLRKARFLTVKQFKQVRFGEAPEGDPPIGTWVSHQTLHAAMDRQTFTTGGEGQLYQTQGTLAAHDEENIGHLDLYARATDTGIEELLELMRLLAMVGHGKDKSVGSGHFELLEHEMLEGWDELPGADGFVSLSSFVPAAEDPTDGYWRIRVKYGKVGEHLGAENPFKRPLIQFEPGAVFKTEVIRPWYGRIVEDLSPEIPGVVQGCQTVAIPLKWRV